MPRSKPFAIATEGPTVDGRNISRDWIQQMAKTYDPKVYTAVTNLEHYLSSVPDSIFSAYGKVVSLSTQEAQIMGDKKLQLLAVVDVADSVVEMQKAGKKAFASMEVKDNFINKGLAYLTGLAFTDTPASIGTESMKFSAFAGAKDEVYSFASEVALEFEAETTTNQPKDKTGETLFAKVTGLLTGKGKADDAKFSDITAAIEAIAESQKAVLDQIANFNTAVAANAAAIKAQGEAAEASSKAFKEFAAKLDNEPADPKRKEASGGTGVIETDC